MDGIKDRKEKKMKERKRRQNNIRDRGGERAKMDQTISEKLRVREYRVASEHMLVWFGKKMTSVRNV